jgi:hypothetical protein
VTPTAEQEFAMRLMAAGQELKTAVDLLINAPAHWHTTLLVEIASENLIHSMELMGGLQAASISRCAWAVRNLLELHYFTRYIVASPQNARRFYEDMACDYQSLLSRFKKSAVNAPVVAAAKATFDQVWPHIGSTITGTSAQYLSTRDIAISFGEEEVYGDTHKLLSKFVHPTSLSIQFRKLPELVTAMRQSIIEIGVSLIVHTLPPLASHITEYHANVNLSAAPTAP